MMHSRAVVVAMLLGLGPVAIQAQGGLTVKGGLSYGNVSNRGLLPGALDVRTGFAAGLSLSPSGSNLLGLGVDALYAERRLHSGSDADSRDLHYIDVPLYLQASLPVGEVAPFAYAGPQVSFELACHAGTGDCPNTGRPAQSYAAVIGGGVRLGSHHGVSLEGRYIYGLTDLKLSTVTSSASYKTRSFLFLAGFSF